MKACSNETWPKWKEEVGVREDFLVAVTSWSIEDLKKKESTPGDSICKDNRTKGIEKLKQGKSGCLRMGPGDMAPCRLGWLFIL